jgi:hypothetical protein
MNEHLQKVSESAMLLHIPLQLTSGNSRTQAIKKAKSCFEVMFALAGRVFPKFSQELPKMQRSMTESRLPA